MTNRTAIVTGASHPKGIGRAIAICLARSGVNVVATDLQGSTGLDTIAAEIASHGVKGHAIACDVTSKQDIERVISETKLKFGAIDILVNNAGVGMGSANFLEVTDTDWNISLAVNLKGLADFCQAAIPEMLSQDNAGCIINIASLSGLGAIEDIPVCYTASKFAVIGLTKQLAVQYAKDGIRVNAICPGSIHTQMHETVLDMIANENNISIAEAQKLEDSNIPLGFTGKPDVVGDTVVYLASDSSRYMTGVALPVAGGMSPGL
ncbi:SDR family oxidoreductase [Thalassotalea fonticola]|uniref:SDR family oxidoreductase n=1 Tax=Thalassotalea fonticola TaxID=3065649 RepID=A0ABZ0GM66_9GAMM|nr:SDR family oxidoreductase [Colwelliaceae bacterium S1-1]